MSDNKIEQWNPVYRNHIVIDGLVAGPASVKFVETLLGCGINACNWTVAVGKLDDPMLAERSLAQGRCDMIALARQLLCDPHWLLKVKSDRPHEIVHCRYCETCHRALHNGEAIRCAQNRNLYGEPVYERRR